jgi:hypothetical protein
LAKYAPGELDQATPGEAHVEAFAEKVPDDVLVLVEIDVELHVREEHLVASLLYDKILRVKACRTKGAQDGPDHTGMEKKCLSEHTGFELFLRAVVDTAVGSSEIEFVGEDFVFSYRHVSDSGSISLLGSVLITVGTLAIILIV